MVSLTQEIWQIVRIFFFEGNQVDRHSNILDYYSPTITLTSQGGGVERPNDSLSCLHQHSFIPCPAQPQFCSSILLPPLAKYYRGSQLQPWLQRWPDWSKGDPVHFVRTGSGKGMWANSSQWDKRRSVPNRVGTGVEKMSSILSKSHRKKCSPALLWKLSQNYCSCSTISPNMVECTESIMELLNQKNHILYYLR